MGSEGKMKRMTSRVVTCLALILSCLFMISSCDARSIAIQQVTQRQSSDHEPQQYQLTESEGSNQLTIVVDEPQSSHAQETNLGISRTLRDQTPSSYLLKINEFSELSSKPSRYESAVFDAAGFNWSLLFYPNGNTVDSGKDHISLYVQIENLFDHPGLDVELKLFVYNQHQNKYLTIEDGNKKRFDKTNTQWGFGQLLPLSTFKNSSEGYLVDDTCLLGAEISVIEPAAKTETLSWIRKPETGSYAWIPDLTKPDSVGRVESPLFRVGDRNWKLQMYPNGRASYEGKSLSIVFWSWNFPPDTVHVGTYGWASVRLLNQRRRAANYEKKIGGWFSAIGHTAYHSDNFISLEDLYDESNGYYVNGNIVVQVEFDIVSVTKVVSN